MSLKIREQTTDILTQQAKSLLAFAKVNKEFNSYLLASLPDFSIETDSISDDNIPVSSWLTPSDTYLAEKRLHWLLNEINIRPRIETFPIISFLTNYRHRVLPKNPLFGIVGLAIIGPTLGIINRRKRKLHKMRIFINKATYKRLSKSKLSKLTSQATSKLLAQELEKVGGNAYRLLPETAEWLFTDQKNELIILNDKQCIESVYNFLQTEELFSIRLIEDGETVALAISPTISEEIVSYLGGSKVN